MLQQLDHIGPCLFYAIAAPPYLHQKQDALRHMLLFDVIYRLSYLRRNAVQHDTAEEALEYWRYDRLRIHKRKHRFSFRYSSPIHEKNKANRQAKMVLMLGKL